MGCQESNLEDLQSKYLTNCIISPTHTNGPIEYKAPQIIIEVLDTENYDDLKNNFFKGL